MRPDPEADRETAKISEVCHVARVDSLLTGKLGRFVDLTGAKV
jgi:hypothetical protein